MRSALRLLAIGAPLALVLIGATVAGAGAQVGQPPPPPTPPTGLPPGVGQGRQPPQRPMRDTAALRDSLRGKDPLVQWAPGDSILLRLLGRDDRTIVRFQGDSLSMQSATGEVVLYGRPSAVGQDSSLLVGDTISYNDSLQLVRVRGADIVLRDPARNAADLEAHGVMDWDMLKHRAFVRDARTATVEAGELWYVEADAAVFVADTVLNTNTFMGHKGTLTSCNLREPHYHFRTTEFKMISNSVMVARGTVLYIADVPVFYLPFIINDLRPGRRSGFLTPRFSISDVVRNSPTYRRNVDNLGYYWAISDYVDLQAYMDWRSTSRSTESDPGFLKFTAQSQYRVLSRFLSGNLSLGHSRQPDGFTNTQISWGHIQNFSMDRRISVDLNYVTNTRLQRQHEVLAFRELATIRSRVNYSHVMGPLTLTAGGTRTQYPGQELVDQTLPTLSLSSKPITLAPEVVVTPNFSLTNTQRLNDERLGPLGFRYFQLPDGSTDSLRVQGNSRNSAMNVDVPLQVRGFRWSNTFRITDVENNYPQLFVVKDVRDTSISSTRVYARTFRTEIDWRTQVALPATFFSGTWNLSPSFGISNVHPGPFWVRSERTGGEFVTQRKRPDFGLAISPTFYGLFPGFGPLASIRHTVDLSIAYGYSPAAEVGDAYLAAIGQTRVGYLGSLARSAVSVQMNHVFEGKLAGDTLSGPGRKIRLLSLNMTPLTWDFERAKATGGTGLASDRFAVTARSDLLPGTDIGMDYSLFQGDILSDSAQFKPFLTGLRASFSLSQRSNPLAGLLSLLRPGRAASPPQDAEIGAEQTDEAIRNALGGSATGVGASSRDLAYVVPDAQAWSARLDFTMTRQRPPVGDAIIVENDARTRCAALGVNPFALEQCIREFEQLALADPNAGFRPPGGAFFRQDPRTSVSGSLVTPITQNWAATWSTTYDFEQGEFASHIVNLRRNLHDWEAVFSFIQSAGGNFSFTFMIQLKAQPEIRIDHTEGNFRSSGQ